MFKQADLIEETQPRADDETPGLPWTVQIYVSCPGIIIYSALFTFKVSSLGDKSPSRLAGNPRV